MAFGLSNLGLERTHQELRSDVAAYLRSNPHSSDGSTHLRDYISTPLVNPDLYNADMEQPGQIDMDIDQVSDATKQANRKWEQYLTGLAGNAWGEHIAVQGLANMLQVNIDIICSANPRDEPVTHISCSGTPVGTVTIGLVGQFHYMAPETVQTPPTPVTSPHLQRDDKDTETDDLASEKEEAEVFRTQIQATGLPYESGLYDEDPQANAETIYSIAPSEYQRPIPLLGDPYFEEMCNPDKYPFGTGGLTAQRQTPLTIRRYFNQRLLHADGRFARDVEYLLAAQYAV